MLNNPGRTGNLMSFGSSFLVQENVPLLFNSTSSYYSITGTALGLISGFPDHFQKGLLDVQLLIDNISHAYNPVNLSSINYTPETTPAVSTSIEQPYIEDIDWNTTKIQSAIDYTPSPNSTTHSQPEEQPTIGPQQPYR